MRGKTDKFTAILAIILGVLIFVRPELLSWIIALIMIIWGLSKLL